MLKIEKELKKVKNPVLIQVAKHLINKSKEDSTVFAILSKENKSLSELESYIGQEVRKVSTGGMVWIDDPVVYGWAQHYYEDDSISMMTPGNQKSEPQKADEVSLPDEELDDFDF